MRYRVKYTDRSSRNILGAIKWYEGKQNGLGGEYLNCIEKSLERIQKCPELYKIITPPIRRCVVRRFPFSIYFSIEDKIIVIHSIFDNRMDPEKLPRDLIP